MQELKIIRIIPINELNTKLLENLISDDQVILGAALIEDENGNQKFDWVVSNKYGGAVPYLLSEDWEGID